MDSNYNRYSSLWKFSFLVSRISNEGTGSTLIKDYYWLITTISFIICIFLFTVLAHAGGKIYEPKDPKYGTKKQYTNQQKEHRGINDKKKKYTTCRLMKRIKSRVTKRQACIYRGGNKTYTLMYEDNCPTQYKCVYNPWSKEPSIDDIVESLNSIKKGNK